MITLMCHLRVGRKYLSAVHATKGRGYPKTFRVLEKGDSDFQK